jgi:AcrR family transcriptional regulator
MAKRILANINLERRAEIGQLRRERTRKVIVDAAFEVFAKQGFDATSTDHIIAAAGIARGTFYNYFETKEDLMAHIGRQLVDDLDVDIRKMLRGVTDPAERLTRRMHLLYKKSTESPNWGWLMIHMVPLGPLGTKCRSGFVTDLKNGKAAGRIDFPSIQAALDMIQGTLVFGVRSTLLSPKPLRRHGEAVILSILRGLGLDESDAGRLARSSVSTKS